MSQFKNTNFREGYNPTFPDFKKAHAHVIDDTDMEEAFAALTGKKPDIETNTNEKSDGITTKPSKAKKSDSRKPS